MTSPKRSPRTTGRLAGTTQRPVRRTLANGFTLAAEYPALAAELHPSKNPLPPAEYALVLAPAGNVDVWWQCAAGHEWRTTVVKRSRTGHGCATCGTQAKSLRTVGGLLLEEFAADLNEGLSVDTVTYGTERPVTWRCGEAGHTWTASPANRSRWGVTPCPSCSRTVRTPEQMLPFTHPHIAAQYHRSLNDVGVEQIAPGGDKLRYWQCPDNPLHVWLAVPYARTRPAGRGTGCPVCNRHSWTPNAVLGTLASLLAHREELDTLGSTERRVVMSRLGIDRASKHDQRDALTAFTAAGLTLAEVYLAAGGSQDELDRVRAIRGARADQDELAADSAALDPDEPGMPALLVEQATFVADSDGVDGNAVLAVLDSPLITAVTADSETLDYLIGSAVAKLWLAVSALPDLDQPAWVSALRAPAGELGQRAHERFVSEYRDALALPVPDAWAHEYQPLLMQRLTALRVQRDRRVANWSGTGAGKTLSAVLAAGVLNADVTLIVCPNSVVDNWAGEIKQAYPHARISKKTMLPNWDDIAGAPDSPRFLIVNFEALQQDPSTRRAETMLARHRIDFVVVDELHYVKQREQASDASRRKKLLGSMLTRIAQANPAVAVLAMTATPVLNDLHEARSLVELVTGQAYPELGTRPTLDNAFRMHALLTRIGLRLSGERVPYEVITLDVDATHLLARVKRIGPGASPLVVDRLLTEARLPAIIEACTTGEPVLLYTHYVDGIVPMLTRALRAAGLSVCEYTGTNKLGLEQFLDGHADVLVASAPISTGVDKLQYRCRTLVINTPPWTAAETEQLIGRLARKNQPAANVDVIIPQAFIQVGAERWEWDANRMARIAFKDALAKATVDGVVPDSSEVAQGELVTALMARLVELGEQIPAALLHPAASTDLVPFEHPAQDLVGPRRDYGLLARVHSSMNRAYSTTTNAKLTQMPGLFDEYHAALDSTRGAWDVDPVWEAVTVCQAMPGAVIADFGCGATPRIANELAGTHVVHSFDHQSRDPRVVAGDMACTPLPDSSVDIAVFSLSLMGANAADYLREAHRVLTEDGLLLVWEASGRIRSMGRFALEVEGLGFTDVQTAPAGRFTHLVARRGDHAGADWARLTFTSSRQAA